MLRKVISAASLLLLMLVGTAFAEQTTFTVDVELAQPFAIDSVSNADFGVIYTKGSAETITMDATTIVPAVGDDVAAAAPTFTTGKISRGGPPVLMSAPQKSAVIYIEAIQKDVDLAVSLVGTPTLEVPYSTASTPITVTGITSNVAAVNSSSIGAGKFVSLCVGPILSVPANAEIGSYTGTVTVDVTAI